METQLTKNYEFIMIIKRKEHQGFISPLKQLLEQTLYFENWRLKK